MPVQAFPGELQVFGDLQHCSLKRFLIALTFMGSVQSPFVKKCIWKNSGKELKIIQMFCRLPRELQSASSRSRIIVPKFRPLASAAAGV